MPKVNWKPGALLAPVPPALVSCGTMTDSNIITVAWTGIVNTIPPMTYISVRPERHSYRIIKESGEFVINLTTRQLVRAADWCGARSGASHNKFDELGLHREAVSNLSCPAILEAPVNLECTVREIIPLGSHDMFLADIKAVNVDSRLLDSNGRLCLEKADLVAYAHGSYFALGECIGTFGFSVRKKPLPKKSPGRRR